MYKLNFLTFFAMLLSYSTGQSLEAKNLCVNKYDYASVLTVPKCESKAKILIYGEIHNDPNDNIIGNIAASLGDNKNHFYFSEGVAFKKEPLFGYNNGLEDSLVHAISAVEIAQPILMITNTQDMDTIQKIIIDKYGRISFLNAFILQTSLWGQISRFDETSDKIVNLMLEYIRKADLKPDMEKPSVAAEIYSTFLNESMDKVVLSALAQLWLTSAYDLMNKEPRYAFLKGSKENLISDGRDIFFAKSVLEKVCDASQEKKNIWIRLGKKHVEGVKCLLQTYLPDAKIESIDVNSFKSNLLTEDNGFEKTEAFKKLRDYILSQDPTASIEVAEDRGGLHTLLLKLPKVPLDVTALDKILNENGYTIILDQSVLLSDWPTLVIAPKLGQ